MKTRFPIKHPSGYVLLQGLRLTARNWPCLLWACVASIPLLLFAGSPLCFAIERRIADKRFTGGIAAFLGRMTDPVLSQTEALRRLVGNLDATSLKQLAQHMNWSSLAHRIPASIVCVASLELAALLFIVAGTLYIYLASEPPRFTVLLKGGAKYFWRFLCALFLGALLSGPVLAALIFLRHLFLLHAGKIDSAHTVFVYSTVSAAILVILALLMILWLDLVEVHAIRGGMLENSGIGRSLLTSINLILGQFFWICLTFLVPLAVGLGVLATCLFFWRSLFQGNHLWTAYLDAQLGVFLLLATRFWQRGMEVALTAVIEPSTAGPAALSQVQPQAEEANPPVAATVSQSLPPTPQPNPTLQELVQKLKSEPWAKPDIPSLKTLFPEPPASRRPGDAPISSGSPPPAATPTRESPLAKHARKTRLVEATAEEPAPKPEPSESVPGAVPESIPEPVPGPRLVPGQNKP